MFKRLAQLLRQDDIESQVAGKDESFAVPVPRVWGVYWESSQIWGLKMGNTHGKHRDDSLIHQHFLGTSRHVQTHAYIYMILSFRIVAIRGGSSDHSSPVALACLRASTAIRLIFPVKFDQKNLLGRYTFEQSTIVIENVQILFY
jgi:hypothetical protein